MTKDQLLNMLEDSRGDLVPKRCTISYLQNNNLVEILDQFVTQDFGTIKDRIKHLKYGGGYCLVCSERTKVSASGRGFAEYCSKHFHQPKIGKQAHNNKNIDMEHVCKLYLNDKMSIVQISRQLGNISNVSLKRKMVEAGIQLRSHSENQKLHANKESTGPKIIIDRTDLVSSYKQDKVRIAILAEKYNCSPETIRRFLIQEGIERTNRRSVIEWKVIDILDRHNIQYRTNVKNIISPLELDILIPSHNIAIEINGLYTHSLHTGNKDKKYHHNKYMMCKDKSIRLLQFWEDDINNKIDIIESMILHRCKISSTNIDARKCSIRQLDFNSASKFFELNHIQGAPSNNTKTLALFYKDRIIAAVGYCKGSKQTVIARYCCLLNHNVRGGFGKLISQLEKPLITYSSNDVSWGELYSRNLFQPINATKFDLWYTDYQQIYNRQLFMKHKLNTHTLINTFDPCKSEVENMIANGFDAIYKSGTVTWQLT